MELAQAEQLARDEMNKNGLHEWGFYFDDAKARFGCCHYRGQQISLSKHLVTLNTAERVQQTIWHEIAHALAPKGSGHGEAWRVIALRLGDDGARCYTYKDTVTPEPKHVYECTTCGEQFKTFKRLQNITSRRHADCKRLGKAGTIKKLRGTK